MRIRLLLAVFGVLMVAACGESGTAPSQLKPAGAAKDEITCRSGYHIATRDDGSQFCEPDTGVLTTSAAEP